MEDIRTYRIEEDDQWHIPDDERVEWGAASEDEVPFHIPRD
jgi:hypothetical protein